MRRLFALLITGWMLWVFQAQRSIAADVLVQAGNVADLRSKIDNSPANSRLDLGGGTFDVGGTQLFVNRSLVTIANGTIKSDALPKFVSPGDKDSRNFLMLIGADSRGVKFENVTLLSNNGIFWVRPGSQDFTVTDCTLSWGTNGNYYNKHALVTEAGSGGHLRTTIENNQIGPSPNADRFCEAWNLRDARIRWNRFIECRDGGHYMDVAGTFKLIGNHYLRMSRMIFGEMQNECRGADVEIAYNVADGVVRWWNDTFGGSWVCWGAAKLEVHHNYWRGTPLTPNGPMDPGIAPRLGIINEVAGDNVSVHDNVAGGPVSWFNYVASAARGTAVATNNVLYGTITEAAMLEGEPKQGGGSGNITDGGNNQKQPASLMPLPDNYLAAVQHAIGPRSATQPTAMTLAFSWPPSVLANGGGATIVTVSNLPTGTARVRINSRASGDHTLTDIPRVAPTPVDAPISGGVATVVVSNIHPGWQIDLIGTAFNAQGAVITTTDWMKTPNFPGNGALEPWPPSPPDDPIVKVDTSITRQSGKVEKFSTTRPVQ